MKVFMPNFTLICCFHLIFSAALRKSKKNHKIVYFWTISETKASWFVQSLKCDLPKTRFKNARITDNLRYSVMQNNV